MALYRVGTSCDAAIAFQNLNVKGAELGITQQRIST